MKPIRKPWVLNNIVLTQNWESVKHLRIASDSIRVNLELDVVYNRDIVQNQEEKLLLGKYMYLNWILIWKENEVRSLTHIIYKGKFQKNFRVSLKIKMTWKKR